MKLIAHRGLFNGPDVNLENRPEQIELAINEGYDCEIDLWVIKDKLYLGHDFADYKIDESLLYKHESKLWIHAKNIESLYWLSITDCNYFWHQNDDYVLTSHRYIWSYPGKELTENSIMLMPEWSTLDIDVSSLKCYGICSDYVSMFK